MLRNILNRMDKMNPSSGDVTAFKKLLADMNDLSNTMKKNDKDRNAAMENELAKITATMSAKLDKTLDAKFTELNTKLDSKFTALDTKIDGLPKPKDCDQQIAAAMEKLKTVVSTVPSLTGADQDIINALTAKLGTVSALTESMTTAHLEQLREQVTRLVAVPTPTTVPIPAAPINDAIMAQLKERMERLDELLTKLQTLPTNNAEYWNKHFKEVVDKLVTLPPTRKVDELMLKLEEVKAIKLSMADGDHRQLANILAELKKLPGEAEMKAFKTKLDSLVDKAYLNEKHRSTHSFLDDISKKIGPDGHNAVVAPEITELLQKIETLSNLVKDNTKQTKATHVEVTKHTTELKTLIDQIKIPEFLDMLKGMFPDEATIKGLIDARCIQLNNDLLDAMAEVSDEMRQFIRRHVTPADIAQAAAVLDENTLYQLARNIPADDLRDHINANIHFP
jgi:acyl transferase domain-containing protein